MAEKLKITLVKSPIGAVPKHKATVEALGLKKLNKTVEMPDNSAVRGMIQCVRPVSYTHLDVYKRQVLWQVKLQEAMLFATENSV